MNFVPYYFETLVLPFPSEEVFDIINLNTITRHASQEYKDQLFIGSISKRKFRIYERLNRPDNFLPVIRGRIESTSKGCIIFTSYNLLFSTALFLSFWTIVTLFLFILFLFEFNQILYAALSLLACILNYVFASNQFNRKVKKSRETFYSLFTG